MWGLTHRSFLWQGCEASSQPRRQPERYNRALYMICLARMRRDLRTKEYVSRRTAEGQSKREIIRCLKRYVAREVYRYSGARRVADQAIERATSPS